MIFINLITFLFLFKSIYSVNIQIKKSELTNKPTELIKIETKLGSIIGYKQDVNISNLVNKKINVFYGIPYAQPIDKSNRFKKAKPITKFKNDPYLALSFKPHCAQFKSMKFHKDDQFSEDCLYMNLWTPDLESIKQNDGTCKKKFSVMIYIYGGYSSIFQISPLQTNDNSSHLSYSGELFSSLYNTILITINFRQMLFSSLFLENEFPGNLALFDQNQAIQWVKDNIQSFCGDDKITLYGNSLGSMTISAHLISKYSKNLINNAIMVSSSNFFQFSGFPPTKNQILINSLLAIHKLSCLNLTKEKINEKNIDNLDQKIKMKYFRYMNGQYLLKNNYFLSILEDNWLKFNPSRNPNSSIEEQIQKGSYIEKDGYLDKDFLKLIKFLSYTVDLKCLQEVSMEKIINLDADFNVAEWSFYYDFDFLNTESYLNYKIFNKLNVNKNLNLLIGNIKNEGDRLGYNLRNEFYTDQFNAPVIHKEDAKNKIINNVKMNNLNNDLKLEISNYYTNESKWELSRGYYDALLNSQDDAEFYCPIYFYSNYVAMSGANSVFNFLISYQSTKHFGSKVFHIDLEDYAWLADNHGDDTNYIFGMPFILKSLFTDIDRKFSLKILELWTYFAKNGKMNRLTDGNEWPSANRYDPKLKYVEINGPFLREKKFEFEIRCNEFWRDIFLRYKK